MQLQFVHLVKCAYIGILAWPLSDGTVVLFLLIGLHWISLLPLVYWPLHMSNGNSVTILFILISYIEICLKSCLDTLVLFHRLRILGDFLQISCWVCRYCPWLFFYSMQYLPVIHLPNNFFYLFWFARFSLNLHSIKVSNSNLVN